MTRIVEMVMAGDLYDAIPHSTRQARRAEPDGLNKLGWVQVRRSELVPAGHVVCFWSDGTVTVIRPEDAEAG